MPQCEFCHEHDHPKLMEYAPKAERYCHRACLLERASVDPWREPIFSRVVELGLRCQVPGQPAVTCRRGHKMTPENVWITHENSRDVRRCRACLRERRRRGQPNRAEADRKRRDRQQIKARNWERTHCRQGHEYTPENIVLGRYGEKKCRECLREGGRNAARRRWGRTAGQESVSGPKGAL